MTKISLKNIYKTYDTKPVLEDYSIDIEKNKINLIIGKSGRGKTTLLHIIAGVLQEDSGDLKDIENLKISIAFQEPRLLPNLNVKENIAFVLPKNLQHKDYINKILKEANLYNYRDKYPFELSGGYCQRLSLARALAVPADLYLLDEPFSNIDLDGRIALWHWLKERQKEQNATVLLVTHYQNELLEENINLIEM